MATKNVPHDAKEFRVNLSLKGMKKCISLTVPEIRVFLDEVPAGTKQLYLILEDLDFHNFPHGTKLISFDGFNGVLQDSFTIIPLCPPQGQHQYRLTVRALDKEDEVIGTGQTIQQFPE